MTTYFYRNPDGSRYSHVLPNVAPVFLATALVPGSALEPYWQSLGTLSMAPNATHDDEQEGCTAAGDDEWQKMDDAYYSNDNDDAPGAGQVGDPFYGSASYGMIGGVPMAGPYGGDNFKYPDLGMIRPYRNLHSLLHYIQPARLQNSVLGPTLDIVEEGTDHKFAIAVPKKMLVLFCGRNVVNRFLRTLERQDNENWQGGPVTQELRFPRHHTNHVGVKIVVSWMYRACVTPKKAMLPMRVPKNTFAALSLSRALTAFGLHRDASHVDHTIASVHFKRRLDFDNVVSIWKCLPKDSKYVYRMVEDLRKQLDRYEKGEEEALVDAEKVLEFLDQHPGLMRRIQDKEYNDRQEFRPHFGTEWCERAALRTQQTMASLVDMKGDDASMSREVDHDIAVSKQQSGKNWPGRQHHDQNLQKPEPIQSQQRAMTLTDREPKSVPTAWPKFEKPIVLTIVEAQEKYSSHWKDRTDSAYGSDDKTMDS